MTLSNGCLPWPGSESSLIAAGIEEIRTQGISDCTLLAQARVGRGTLAAMRRRGGQISLQSLLNPVAAAEGLRREAEFSVGEQEHWRQAAGASLRNTEAKLAVARLGISRPYLTRIISGEKAVTDAVIAPARG